MPQFRTDDVRIEQGDELLAPMQVMRELATTEASEGSTYEARRAIHDILRGADDRLLVVVGPCSIHDTKAALEYATHLKAERERLATDLVIVMRVYFEKPRTTVGWKGLINDPRLDETFDMNEGIRLARKLLLEINELGVPCGTEFLDLITPQYIADLIAWGAIGARTTESQIHREMASALSCPVGFKNGTDGNTQIAIDAIRAARASHMFLSPDKQGQMTIYQTAGNPYGHIIMRGGRTPNYHSADVQQACGHLQEHGLPPHLLVDFSHGNSQKQYRRQLDVAESVCRQISDGSRRVAGIMAESFLVEGSQALIPGQALTYGQSITDGCLGWEDSERLLAMLAGAVDSRF